MAARGRPLKRSLLLGLLVTLVITTSACRRKKAEIRVSPISGESPILPRVASASASPSDTHERLRTIDVDGKRRQYLVVEPASFDPDRKYPLILVFHGDGGDAAGFHHAWPFEHATGKNAVLAYLDGIGSTWDLETTRDNRDVRFAVSVVDTLARELPVDRGRVFATGYSSGGFLSNVIACHEPSLLRAIASNAGGAPYNQLEKWPNGYPKCPGQKPIAMLALHGERDFGVTLDSGRFSAEYWAYVNGCSAEEMETTGYGECRVYRGCPEGKAVGFCSIPPLGHWVWNLAAEASWTFFQKQ